MNHTIIESALTTGLVQSPQDAPAIRWGILGAGNISGTFATAVTQHTASHIAAVASRDVTKAQQFIDTHLSAAEKPAVAYGSYDELVHDDTIDAIYVGTPHSHHHEHALLAIRAGKHVLVEKAFTRNAAEARDLHEAARQTGVFVMEAMWTRFLPHIAALKDVIARGTIGDIVTVFADHGQNFPLNPTHRLYDPHLAGGALLDLGVYPISFMHDLLGAPDHITARGKLAETGVDGQISMIFEHGERTQSVVNTTVWGTSPNTAAVVGSLGRIEIDGWFYAPSGFTVTLYTGEKYVYECDDVYGFEWEAAEVARCITSGKTHSDRMSWTDTIEVMETMDEVRRQTGVIYPGE
ncbi:Gfo/Idh/MocA family protein [Timonella sp. A28]|uniref:Gfo/Idh/MocA family protein n=1 Tax=Timonella sp. A28 TaxID=3442640 RepID=UPI003EBDC381